MSLPQRPFLESLVMSTVKIPVSPDVSTAFKIPASRIPEPAPVRAVPKPASEEVVPELAAESTVPKPAPEKDVVFKLTPAPEGAVAEPVLALERAAPEHSPVSAPAPVYCPVSAPAPEDNFVCFV